MIGVLDYGSGNVRAFLNVYQRLGVRAAAIDSIDKLSAVSHVVLPGVGAFDTAMSQFTGSGMREAVERLVAEKNVRVLGVCVGMQMMGDSSEEGLLSGLSWIPGRVRSLQSLSPARLRLPHMGWNSIEVLTSCPLLRDLPNGGRFYFLHSFCFDCANPNSKIAVASYGSTFPCAIQSGSFYGVQFHPEKSHEDGVKLLENFSKI